MSNLLDLNPKYAGHTIEDLQRVGSLGDEEAIMELGRRYLDEIWFDPMDCEECDCDQENSEIYDLESEVDNLNARIEELEDDLRQKADDLEVLLSVEE